MTTRRTVLSVLASVPAAAVLAPSAVLAIPLSAHPDAKLLATYAEYHALDVEYYCDHARGQMSEALRLNAYRRLCDLEDRMHELGAETPAGLAVLALLAMRATEALEHGDLATWDGHSKPESAKDSFALRSLWAIVESARAMAVDGRVAREVAT